MLAPVRFGALKAYRRAHSGGISLESIAHCLWITEDKEKSYPQIVHFLAFWVCSSQWSRYDSFHIDGCDVVRGDPPAYRVSKNIAWVLLIDETRSLHRAGRSSTQHCWTTRPYVRRHHPITTKDCLVAAIEASPGVRGVPKARTALGLCIEGTDSIPETDLRLLLVEAGLPAPKVNLMVMDLSGQWYFFDLAYEQYKLAIEYDGAYHVGDRNQMFRDAARRRTLEDLGWRIITVTSADLYRRPSSVIQSVCKALLSR